MQRGSRRAVSLSGQAPSTTMRPHPRPGQGPLIQWPGIHSRPSWRRAWRPLCSDARYQPPCHRHDGLEVDPM
eukprot:5745385-Pyramimonas_sp.AAC.1